MTSPGREPSAGPSVPLPAADGVEVTPNAAVREEVGNLQGRQLSANPPSRQLQQAFLIFASLVMVGATAAAAVLAKQLHGNQGWAWETIVTTVASPVSFAMAACLAHHLYSERAITHGEARGMTGEELIAQSPQRLATLDVGGLAILLTKKGGADYKKRVVADLTDQQVAVLPREIQELWTTKEPYPNQVKHQGLVDDARRLTEPGMEKAYIRQSQLANAIPYLEEIKAELEAEMGATRYKPVFTLQVPGHREMDLTVEDCRVFPKFNARWKMLADCNEILAKLRSPANLPTES